MKVLLVDDSSAMRKLLRLNLGKLNITEIEEAEEGHEALDKLLASHFDVVFLDLIMPPMDGLACLKKIRFYERLNSVKIIVCTSQTDQMKSLDVMAEGADRYIDKKITPEILHDVLSGLDLF